MDNVKKVLLATILLLTNIISYRVISYINLIYCKKYSCWIRNFMGPVGFSSTIAYPCSLQENVLKKTTIGEGTTIQSHCILGCWDKCCGKLYMPSVTIGDDCSIGEYNHISACNKITIGDWLLTGRYVYIGDNAYGGLSLEEANIPPVKRQLVSKGEIKIGNNVWIGDKTTILGGVTIGNNVIIAANAVVTTDVGDNCVIAGGPAKVVKCIK